MSDRHLLLGTLLLIGLALVLAPFASDAPDGFEHTHRSLALSRQESPASAPLPGYAVPWLGQGPLPVMLAGLLGVGLVMLCAWLLLRPLTPVDDHPVDGPHP